MEHYLDIQLRPDPEFGQAMLMGALFNKLHRALVEMEADDIGVSFPRHQLKPRGLGNMLRLHSSADRLVSLMAREWLTGMHDHIQVSDVELVPPVSEYRIVRRRQFKTNVERLRRRRMKRHGESYAEAAKKIRDSVEQHPPLPYVNLRSRSSGQTFSLFIEHQPAGEAPSQGGFNAYGLSDGSSVPWF